MVDRMGIFTCGRELVLSCQNKRIVMMGYCVKREWRSV